MLVGPLSARILIFWKKDYFIFNYFNVFNIDIKISLFTVSYKKCL